MAASSSTSSSQQISLLSIGTASHRTFNLGIKIPTFELSQKFALKHNLVQQKSISQTRSSSTHSAASNPTLKFNVKEVIDSKWKATGAPGFINEEKLTYATESLSNQIGAALSTGKHVRIDFGIGTLVGVNNCVTFEFTQRPDVGREGTLQGISPRTRKVKEESGHEYFKEVSKLIRRKGRF